MYYKLCLKFFHALALRLVVLKYSTISLMPDSRHETLIANVRNSIDSNTSKCGAFSWNPFPATHALKKLKDSGNKETLCGGNQLLVSIQSEDFLINLNTASKLFLRTIDLCKYLQSVSCNLVTACDNIDNVILPLSMKWDNRQRQISHYFLNELRINRGNDDDFTIVVPRRVGCQKYRSNVAADTPEKYYRCT